MLIINVPSNTGGLSKKEGVELGPQKIVKYIDNFYLKENGHLPVLNFETVNVNNFNVADNNKQIYDKIENNDVPAIVLGGDHSITYSSFKGFASKYKNAGLIVFDAHLDCENNFSPPSHEDYLRVLIEEGIVKKENVVLVGIRNMHSNEFEYAKKNKIKIFDMHEIAKIGKVEAANAFCSVVKEFESAYISVDIDVLDPAFAPGTGYIEPGGLTTRELIYFIHRLKLLKNIGMWDLVEVNPKKDVNNLTAKTAAKLVVEMC